MILIHPIFQQSQIGSFLGGFTVNIGVSKADNWMYLFQLIVRLQ